MKRSTFLLGTALLPGAAMAMGCDELTAEGLGLSSGVRITETAALSADDTTPVAMCQVRAVMAERIGTDGHPYALRFEINLPENWNDDYVHQFNGGNDGEVKPATGALTSGTGARAPLERGYAVVSSDAGHDGADFAAFGLAGGAAFGFDFEARQMYGYKAVAMLDPVARQMVETFYGQPIDHAYGVGCSNGGRHAMVAAARMPAAFDGLLIGAPGYNLPRAALQHAWDVQQALPLNGTLKSAFSRQDLALVAGGIRDACDGLDGLRDGLVSDAVQCQATFDITTLQCIGAATAGCLSAEQVNALSAMHDGPRAPDGTALYSDWSWDTGIEGGNWRFWKLESPIPPWGHRPIIATMGAASLAQVFTVPPTPVDGTPEALEQFLMSFELSTQATRIDATSPDFPESPMQIMTPPGSDAPDLADFRAAGGRMVLFHGVSDPVFSVNDTARWYDKLDANTGGRAAEFARFYPVPGMTHCSGGPAPEAFDLFSALVDWVEADIAPEAVTATARPGNEELPTTLVGVTRPLCPAPRSARYTGSDPASADSFTCQ